MDTFTYPLIFLTGFVASFVGTNVGGGGLIIIPVLIFLGLPPQVAVATSRFGITGLASVGLLEFHKGHKVNYRIGIPLVIFSMIGAYIGADTLVGLSEGVAQKLIAIGIIIVLFLFVINKNIGIKHIKPAGHVREFFGYIACAIIGFWAALVGAGAAILASYILILVFGQTFLESAGTRKLMILPISIVALCVFIANGLVNWSYGGVLFVGCGLGSYVGARYGLRHGDKWVRKMFIVVVLVSALKLLFT